MKNATTFCLVNNMRASEGREAYAWVKGQVSAERHHLNYASSNCSMWELHHSEDDKNS